MLKIRTKTKNNQNLVLRLWRVIMDHKQKLGSNQTKKPEFYVRVLYSRWIIEPD